MHKIAQLTILCASFVVPHAFAQDSPKLILQTSPESTEISLKDSVSISGDGTITATPVDADACQATGSCEGVTVSVTAFDSPSEQSGTITVNEGANVELTWRSSGATSCQPAGDYQPWLSKGSLAPDSRDATASQKTLNTSNAADSSPYELKLQCSNGTVSSAIDSGSTLSLVVNEVVPPSPTSCEGREPISGWTRLSSGCVYGDSSTSCRNWSSIWGDTFLGSGSNSTKDILTNRTGSREYVAIAFSTTGMSNTADGIFFLTKPDAVVTNVSGKLRLTVSKCPGDFNPSQPTGCYFHNPLGNPRWRAPQSSSSANCVLEPNTTYYLNMLTSDSSSTTLPAAIQPNAQCEDSLCGLLFQRLN